MRRMPQLLALALTVGSLVVVSGQTRDSRPVTNQDLLDGLKDPAKWLMFGGTYSDQRHSPLTQLTPQNVAALVPQWVFQTDQFAPGRGFETTPLVLDGVLYATGNNNTAFALDARTGRMIWRYKRVLPDLLRVCCGPVNRGFGILGDKLFMGTLDAHLIALNRKTGEVMWDSTVEEPKNGYAITMAPLVVKNLVIVGVAGGDYATRGFIDAYDAESGKRAWRFYTVPGPGEKGSDSWPSEEPMLRGGGNPWVTGSYDPDLNLVYFGTGNANPDYWGDDRKGDNLYTCSLVALDATTGQLKWYFQFTPHDVHDWDSTHVPVLADVPFGNRVRKVVMVANRNSFFYVIDRQTGEFILGKPYTTAALGWARELDAKGRPIIISDLGSPDHCIPDNRGGTLFMPPSYDPARHLFFVTARETCAMYEMIKPQKIVLGAQNSGGSVKRIPGHESYSALRAIDPTTGLVKWEHRFTPIPSQQTLDDSGGATSTASGLVFGGDNDGYLNAFESSTGKLLWRFQTGAPIWGAPPVTYMLDGRQWVVEPSGVTLTAFALPQK
jgi:alcohol dehydrogenase (cytochrome c)